jgi:hypothetical protein
MKRIAALLVLVLLVLGTSIAGRADDTPAPNDNFADSIEIPAVPAVTGLQGRTTVEPGEDTSCTNPEQPTGTAWYDWRAADATPMVAYMMLNTSICFLCSPTHDTVHVYQKVRSNLISIGCSLSVTFMPQPKGHYFFQVAGYFQLRLNRAPDDRPSFDNFADRMNLIIPPFHYEDRISDIDQATLEPDEPTACGHPLTSDWYTFRGDATRLLNVHVDNGPPVYIVVYVRAPDGSLQPVPRTCFQLAPDSFLEFPLTTAPGEQYFIQIGQNTSDEFFDHSKVFFSICDPYTPLTNCFF